MGVRGSSQMPEAKGTNFEDALTDEENGGRCIEIPRSLSVRELADLLHLSAIEVIKRLMRNGVIASINQVIGYEMAAAVAGEAGYEVRQQKVVAKSILEQGQRWQRIQRLAGDDSARQLRPPVVTVMGHVDHGKTRLLDAIRQTNVIATEAGGVTQHIGAYQVEVKGHKITFLDTPGHEAFTAMRARGAQITDIAVLVVAADDGVMPQTIEAIDHARAANVPIVVAINKIDKPNIDVERVKQQLAEQGLLIEEWGGDVISVPISAKRGDGINELLESILIVAEMAEIKVNYHGLARGVVVEAGLDRARGPMATVLVQEGILKAGDIVVVGNTWGRIKAMFNDKGVRVRKAEPATPAEILGLDGVPQAGDALIALHDRRESKLMMQRQREEKEREQLGGRTSHLGAVLSRVEEGVSRELNIVLKVDVQGSIEPIRTSLERLESEQIRARVIHSGTGSITEGDVLLATASEGIIVGFNTRPETGAQRLAELNGVDIRCYEVIYELVDDIGKALQGMLEPEHVEVVGGHVEVRAVFSIRKGLKIAGGYALDGEVRRGDMARVLRDGKLIHQAGVSSLKRFKDDVKEVSAGFECGIGIEGFNDFQVGDIIELYSMKREGGA
jgi:translation initiation factor IF-2